MSKKITVLGAGAWGTALSLSCITAGNAVTLWTRTPDHANALKTDGENTKYLPNIPLPQTLNVTSDMATAVSGADLILLVVPSQYLRQTAQCVAPHIAPNTPILVCTKGIEENTGNLMTDSVTDEISTCPIGVLSGPNFAHEIAQGLPSATTLAIADKGLGEQLAHTLSHPTFRPYWTDDVIGAEIGGAVKNVIAIACGIVQGKGLGHNAQAGLITRGISEITRLCTASGGRADTIMGLSGMGDLVLTCGSTQSRNTSLGYALAQGQTLPEILANRNSVAEGVNNAKTITQLAEKLGVEMPICQIINQTLHHNLTTENAIKNLLTRPLKPETN